MAINSYGYPSLIAAGSVLARYMQNAGKRYSVGGFSDFRVTAATSGTRRVNIAAGWAFGKGVQVQNTAATTFDFAAPSGTTQWFLLGLKRWAANPAYDPEAAPGTPESSLYISQLVSVAGTATRSVPSVTQNAGSDDTQWLALCRVTSSSTLVAEVIDLRLISGEGGTGYQVFSDLALGQLDDLVGAHVYRADTISGHKPAIYERVTSSSGSLSWQNLTRPETVLEGLAATQVPGSGWSRDADGCRLIRNGNHRSLTFMVRKSGSSSGNFTSNGRGGLGDQTIVAVHDEDRPGSGKIVNLLGRLRQESGGATYACFAHLSAAGNIILNSMLPNVDVVVGDEFYFTGEWYVD